MNNEPLYWSVMALAILIGIALTVIYYFARYYVRMDSSDKEVAPSLKKGGPVDLNEALRSTREGLWQRIKGNGGDADGLQLDSLEEALFTSDIGAHTAQRVFARLAEDLNPSELTEQSVRACLRSALMDLMKPMSEGRNLWQEFQATTVRPQVWMIVGVNGVGKTTTIGKLASQATQQGLKVLIVAGDTYRAAADAQLSVWADRSGAKIHNPEGTKDPAAVAYSGLEYAKAHGFDLVIVDTAGRLHTQGHLMEELKKVQRVMTKLQSETPHQVLLVVDANSGQNALAQAKHFHEALGLTGVILTKMDGTSKGGVAFGLVDEMGLTIPCIGVGEAIEDLRPFSAKEFVESIV